MITLMILLVFLPPMPNSGPYSPVNHGVLHGAFIH